MIFGPFEPHRRQLEFPKILNERKIIESIEPIDSIERSRDRSYRSEAAVVVIGGKNRYPTPDVGTDRPGLARPRGPLHFASTFDDTDDEIFGRKFVQPKSFC